MLRNVRTYQKNGEIDLASLGFGTYVRSVLPIFSLLQKFTGVQKQP